MLLGVIMVLDYDTLCEMNTSCPEGGSREELTVREDCLRCMCVHNFMAKT